MPDYVVSSDCEIQEMLEELGLNTLDELYKDVPNEALFRGDCGLGAGLSEAELSRVMEEKAGENTRFRACFRGAGAYRHLIPAVVDALSSLPAFVTAYTPYQAELSQGPLQSIFEFQTQISRLTGLDVTNASMYDGPTAAAEACLVALSEKRGRRRILYSDGLQPQVRAVMQSYAHANGFQLTPIPNTEAGLLDREALGAALGPDVATVVLPQIQYLGPIETGDGLADRVHAAGARLVLYYNPIAAAILPSAGDWDADLAVAEGQPLGLALAFGGPYLGLMSAKRELVRHLPGRIVGETKDQDGKRAYTLTLQTREQHIRRERASSSICSNQALMALRASVYLATMGREGLPELAQRCVDTAHELARALTGIDGLSLAYERPFFHEFLLCSERGRFLELERRAAERSILSGLPLDDHHMLICATEANRLEDLTAFAELTKEVMTA